MNEPYYTEGEVFEFYAPAYRTGWEGHARHLGKRFEDVEEELRAEYDRYTSGRSPEWSEAREAARSAWDRIEETRVFG